MSTILDALKKSEQERKLNKLPTLVDIRAPQEPSRWPLYLGLVLVLLAAALVVLAYVIWNAAPEVARNPGAGKSIAVLSSTSFEANVADGFKTTEGPNAIKGSALVKDPMLVNVVSYSDDPGLSFAMVNGKLLREGDFVEPGLKIAEIQFNSVVFNARGKKITRSP